MISGVKIPVLCPLKFHAAGVEFNNGVNFNNTDNRSLADQDWQGIYNVCYAHPVPYFWNDGSYGLDFQVYATAAEYANIKAYIIDKDGTEVKELSSESFYNYDPPSGDRQLRFYMDEVYGIDEDEFYRVKITNLTTAIYYSETIQFKEKFNHCFPVTYSNFENDFGSIFENVAGTNWKGKYLLPLRIMEPIPVDERETYIDDNGGLTTLRSLPRRGYKLETLPIPTWLSEILRLTFSCSEITVNKLSVNAEELPEAERITDSDLMPVTGELYLTDFTGNYWIDEKKNTVTELLTDWPSEDSSIEYFEHDGKNILAYFTDDDAGTHRVISNQMYVDIGDVLIINFDVRLYNDGIVSIDDERIQIDWDFIDIGKTMTSSNVKITIDSVEYNLQMGMNVIFHTAQSVAPDLYLEPVDGHERLFLEITPSVLKIS